MGQFVPITEQMHIHSLGGGLAEATITEKVGDNKYIAEYGGVRCTAILIPLWAASMWMTSTGLFGIRRNAGRKLADSAMQGRPAAKRGPALEREVNLFGKRKLDH